MIWGAQLRPRCLKSPPAQRIFPGSRRSSGNFPGKGNIGSTGNVPGGISVISAAAPGTAGIWGRHRLPRSQNRIPRDQSQNSPNPTPVYSRIPAGFTPAWIFRHSQPHSSCSALSFPLELEFGGKVKPGLTAALCSAWGIPFLKFPHPEGLEIHGKVSWLILLVPFTLSPVPKPETPGSSGCKALGIFRGIFAEVWFPSPLEAARRERGRGRFGEKKDH